jgi:hypothetical protein
MPHWNCQDCGARLYSAARILKRQTCPVCQGPLVLEGEDPVPLRRFEHTRPSSVDLPDAPGAGEKVDVPEHL